MDTIRTYPKDSIEYVKLALASMWLERFSKKGTRYEVGDTYFDFGQGWRWTTIIATRSTGDTYQALCPRDHERIIRSDDIMATVQGIVSDRLWIEV